MAWSLQDHLPRSCQTSTNAKALNHLIHVHGSLKTGFATVVGFIQRKRCMNYSEVEGRNLQVPYFVASSDAALQNGTRLTTDYPENSVSPETTVWWDGHNDLPGSEANETATRLSTTYCSCSNDLSVSNSTLLCPSFLSLHCELYQQ